MPSKTTKNSVWTKKHIHGLEYLSVDELKAVLHRAKSYEAISKGGNGKSTALQGKVVANLFFEDSTRTRMSFNLAETRLSADVIEMTASGSSVSKGETLSDTVKNIEAMGVDTIVCRHNQSGSSFKIAQAVKCSVLNAGDGKHEHPTQGLLDIYTVAKRFDRMDTFDLTGLTMAIVGDIANSRVARSNIHGLKKLGANVILVGPSTLLPAGFANLGCQLSTSLDDILPKVDILNMLRVQFERMNAAAFPSAREYSYFYGLYARRMKSAKPDVLVMHPGPINRGIEITSEVADGPNSMILDQVSHGVAIRMACLDLVTNAI